MQGNKKHTEGQSDSSSIGSLLDDTDREVSSLTDRAFKSLCVAELEDSYNEPDLVLSPDFTRQFSAKFHPGALNHAIKLTAGCNKLAARNNDHAIWASTFQQLPKCAPEEKNSAKNNTLGMEKKKLNLPVPGPRNSKHVSKVSSLIKTFDKTANQGSGDSLIASKQPIKNSFQRCKLNHEDNMACCNNTATLNTHKELTEFSEDSQRSHHVSGKLETQKRPNKVDLSYCSSDGCYPVLIEMSKVAKSNFSRSSKNAFKNKNLKVNEPAKKGNFLHSENSAFESWNVHHKKLSEKEELVDPVTKKETLTQLEEAPFIKGSHASELKLPPVKATVTKKQKKDFRMETTPPETAFSVPLPPVFVPQGPLPSRTDFPAALPPVPPPRIQVHQDPPQPPSVPQPLPLPAPTHPPTPSIHEAPPVPPLPQPAQLSPPAMSQTSISPQSVSYRMVSPSPPSQAPVPPPRGLPDTTTEEEAISPPWRRLRATKGVSERRPASEEFPASNETCLLSEKADQDVTPLIKKASAPGSTSPTFNITKLLTPIIPPKQEMDPMESELILLTPPPTESVSERDNEGSVFSDYRSRDSYKSKASSLLFNLKDVRKRVKSIYTPSPLLRVLENRNKTRESMLENLQEKNNMKMAEKDELSDITSVLSESVHEKDNKTDLAGHFTDNYLTLSSPQTTADFIFHQTGDSLQQDHSTREDLIKNTRDNENHPLLGHQCEEPNLRKTLPYSAMVLYSRDNADTTPGQPLKNSSFQAEEKERQAGKQSENVAARTLPSQLSPAEDVFYSDIQTNMLVTGHEAQDKKSPSSSEQSFVSTVEQPFQEEPLPSERLVQKESQRNKAEMSAESKKSHEEGGKAVGEDELQSCATERREGMVTEDEQRSIMKEKLREEKKEEGNGMDSASERMKDASTPRSEEPQTQPSSSSAKPCLFMIKNNTFRSPPVIRAVKLPLFRSFSLDDTVSSSYKEMEGRSVPPTAHSKQPRDMLHNPEQGWLASTCRGQQEVREGAPNRGRDASESGSTSATVDPNILEDAESFLLKKLMEEGEETCALLNEVGKMNEESMCKDKEKPQIRRSRHSLTQPILGLENDRLQKSPSHPTERKANYFKNHNLFNRRGGSCAKKIITTETISPVTESISEDHAYSSVSHEALENMLDVEGTQVLLNSLECSAVTSPRSGSTVHSLVSLPSEKPTFSSLGETESSIDPALLNMALKSQSDTSAEEIFNSTQRHLLLDPAGEAERLGLGERGAGKPPAVPPKTEKALRRAKKLASRRKKIEEQQKKHQTEHTDGVGRKVSHSGYTLASPSPLGYSIHPAPHSTFTPTETSIRRLSGVSAVSPSPSLTQRKLLQDPDSGQYYVVDLPAEVNLKTFYDPETGKYVQVSVPSSEGNVYQPSSSEIRNSPYASYPRALPLPASSVALLKSPSQLSESTWLMPAIKGEPAELPKDGQQDYRDEEAVETQSYIEPDSYSCNQDTEETNICLGKDMSPTPNTALVSLTNLDDLSAEGVS
ncbi:cardiac-enriched FHL2-interacting protein [Cyrtonyx montezumae]|uniref:cardiac-enriched FHL2-interacting protein n=1 Tax=Cyrtonyx montezumae TaxID=9017 RepID=UPI0032DAEF3B